jgi:hypothetical protein
MKKMKRVKKIFSHNFLNKLSISIIFENAKY